MISKGVLFKKHIKNKMTVIDSVGKNIILYYDEKLMNHLPLSLTTYRR
jgi:hypothetical protein